MVDTNLDIFGQLLVREIKKQILLMDLVDTGDLLSSIRYEIKNGSIILISDVDYAEELEYGTYALKSSSDEDFPSTASGAKGLKKKDMDPDRRKSLPKGMVPFAMFRRVLYNDTLIKDVLKETFSK